MGYQTFPWMKGSSDSFSKLGALQIPNLKDKTFLDVGCNEGFFCGYAQYLGASKITGIDINSDFLAVAKALFPGCNFICDNWDNLGGEKYDIILCSSAIHYATDQKKFIDSLVSRLAPHGTLILEIGVAPGADNEFVEVTRSIDKRFFPTKLKLQEMLQDYAYKHISRSVPQAGDPILRMVYHISTRLPFAILALDDPHAGKTYTISQIFRDDITRISGDRLLYDVAHGSVKAPQSMLDIIRKNKRGDDFGYIIYLICKHGAFDDFCAWLVKIAMRRNFILDMYIPASFRHKLAAKLEEAGFYVVNIQLQKAISRPRAEEKAPPDAMAGYLRHLEEEFMIDEQAYLAANPDVAKALAEGKITSALAHYIFNGRKEGRKREPENWQD